MTAERAGPRNWDVNDALRITARFTDWLSTPDAMRLARGHVWSRGELPDEVDLTELAKESNAELAAGIRAHEPIWVDPAMVDLLAAAAGEFPPGDFEPWYLPHPTHGIVILAKPMPADWTDVYDLATGDPAHYRDEICAITWEAPLRGGWIVRSWSRSSARGGLYRLPDVGTVRCPDLRPSAVVETVSTSGTRGGDAARVLVALTALSRTSTNVRETRETGSKAAQKVARIHRMAEPTVRRLYLNRPESGPTELDALRAARAGRPRGHWVRGHWRRQWHASIDEHRWHWIDGYPRGDFEKGVVPGQRIQVARPPHPDTES